jgi:hypothetical protein
MFRSKKFRDLCRDQPCYLQIPGVCNGNSETVVAAHSPNHQSICGPSGVGIKVTDVATCPSCDACHSAIDGRMGQSLGLTGPEDRMDWWLRGYFRWIDYLMSEGKVVVAK